MLDSHCDARGCVMNSHCANSPVFRSMQYDRCETKQNVTGCAIHVPLYIHVHICGMLTLSQVDQIRNMF